MKANTWRARTKHDLIIEVWEALDCESVGARELKQIQKVVWQKFGAGSVDSPASIARTLADEGAVLRHPEVLILDTEWRERELSALIPPDELNFSGLAEASASIKKLDTLRRKFEQNRESQAIGSPARNDFEVQTRCVGDGAQQDRREAEATGSQRDCPVANCLASITGHL